MLPGVADDLTAKGLARISDGALCAFPAGFTGRDGSPLPVIIRKSDGGYNYSSTDLATDPVPGGQAQRATGRSTWSARTRRCTSGWSSRWPGRRAGCRTGDDFEHAQIGMVQGKDGRRLRTRAGDNPSSSATCSTEGVERARAILDEVERDDDGLDLDAIAEDVGIGAIKYADLSTARDSAYVFDLDRMISFKGNTGPYLQYATARIRSIFRRAGHRRGRACAARS